MRCSKTARETRRHDPRLYSFRRLDHIDIPSSSKPIVLYARFALAGTLLSPPACQENACATEQRDELHIRHPLPTKGNRWCRGPFLRTTGILHAIVPSFPSIRFGGKP